MKRVLFDTNVVIDVLLNRQPHVEASAAAWKVVEGGKARGMLAAHAVTTIHYLLRKQLGDSESRRILSSVLKVFEIAPVDQLVVQEALHSPLGDFEDAVAAYAARASDCDWIVTRDPKGFRGSPLRSLLPEGFAALTAEP